MSKIQIKSIWGTVLFKYEKENNTIKDTLEEAVRQGADLDGASLQGANLYGASLDRARLQGANLYGARLYGARLEGARLEGARLVGADLDRARLVGARLVGANLVGANLDGANLDGANLYGARLEGASLDGANLIGANLVGANLVGANLVGANLVGANLDGANLIGTNLIGASLVGAGLVGATNIPFIPFACPSDGAFIGWKKVQGHLVKLEIPEDARRCSCTSQKCRCDKAKVLEITNLENNESVSQIVNESYSPAVTYKVGEMVYPDSFDENRWNECSHGIHFFINKQEAINY